MMKKWLIISMLFTSTVNADIFQALKDAAAKAVEAQKGLNNSTSNENKGNTEPSMPKFSSLAEEEAFKKQQQNQELLNQQKIKENIITRMKNLQLARSRYYEKYFVKQTDTKEMIDMKYKNKAQLVQDMQKDYKLLESEGIKIGQLLDQNPQYDFSQHYKYREFYGAFPYRVEDSDEINYVDSYDGGLARGIDNEESYTAYLKEAYNTYEERQSKIKQLQAQKGQQTKIVSEKVQGACQAWRSKANKQVYSLGVGDQIISKNGIIFIIRGVEANTFLVQWGGNYVYLQKSECIPYLSINSAPSPSCYK